MAKVDGLFSNPLMYRGVFDGELLYNTILSWMKAEKMTIFEKNFKKKSGNGQTEWEVDLIGSLKVDEWQKFQFKVKLKILPSNIVSVNQDGVQKQMIQGRVVIEASGTLTRDHSGIFNGSSFATTLGAILTKATDRSKAHKRKSEGYKMLGKLRGMLKGVLKIEA